MQRWVDATKMGKICATLEFRVVHPDSTVRVLTGRGILLRDKQGRAARMIGTNRDITERKKFEAEQKLQGVILHSLTDGVSVVRLADQKILYANPRLEALFRYGPGELIGQPIFQLITDQQSTPPGEITTKIIAELKRSGRYQGDSQTVKKDGTVIWTYCNIRTFDHPDHGEVWIGIHQDITERKTTEEALRLSENKYRASREKYYSLFNNAQVAIFRSKLDGSELLEVNQKFLEIAGVSLEEAQGKPATLFWADPKEREELLRRIEIEGQVSNFEYKFLSNHREVRNCLTSLKLYREQKVIEGSILDITELKRAEKAVHEAKEAAENANRTKDIFLATLSHELRTPLTSILSWSQLIKDHRVDERAAERGIEIIEHSALAQSRLINDLLDVSRIAAGKLFLEIQETAPAPIINSEIEAISLVATKKQIEIIQDLDSKVSTIFADPVRLHQILWNLLGNALKFTSQGGKIWITLRQKGPLAEFCIRDNGMGIAPDFLAHLFDRFTQADSSSTRTQGGLGLGLAISSSLVKMMGGSIKAESQGKGLGAKFTFELPIHAVALQGESTAKPNEPNLHQKLVHALPKSDEFERIRGTKIIYVDDDPVALEAIKILLESHGAIVRSASSAKEAMGHLSNFTPDLIISDLAMPDIDGYALFEKIRAFQSEKLKLTPILALTAYAGPEDEARALKAGFQGYVSKPVDTHVLLQTVARLKKAA